LVLPLTFWPKKVLDPTTLTTIKNIFFIKSPYLLS
jgi:hypothetical protein